MSANQISSSPRGSGSDPTGPKLGHLPISHHRQARHGTWASPEPHRKKGPHSGNRLPPLFSSIFVQPKTFSLPYFSEGKSKSKSGGMEIGPLMVRKGTAAKKAQTCTYSNRQWQTKENSTCNTLLVKRWHLDSLGKRTNGLMGAENAEICWEWELETLWEAGWALWNRTGKR